MARISVYITFLLTHLSTWPSNWTIALKYTEGVSRFVTALKTVFIYSFSSFRKTERTPICFLLESTSWRWQTISFMITPTVSCTSNRIKWVKEKNYANAQEKTAAKVVMPFKWSILSIKGILSLYELSHCNHKSRKLEFSHHFRSLFQKTNLKDPIREKKLKSIIRLEHKAWCHVKKISNYGKHHNSKQKKTSNCKYLYYYTAKHK